MISEFQSLAAEKSLCVYRLLKANISGPLMQTGVVLGPKFDIKNKIWSLNRHALVYRFKCVHRV